MFSHLHSHKLKQKGCPIRPDWFDNNSNHEGSVDYVVFSQEPDSCKIEILHGIYCFDNVVVLSAVYIYIQTYIGQRL